MKDPFPSNSYPYPLIQGQAKVTHSALHLIIESALLKSKAHL